MARLQVITALLAILPSTLAECGAGTPDASVTGDGTFTSSLGSETIYTGDDYLTAIQTALDAITEGQRVAVLASGSIGTGTLNLASGKTLEGCGTIDAAESTRGKGAILSADSVGAAIPYLHMTGSPYFGLQFYGTTDLALGEIAMELSGGMGIRFDRDEAWNANVTMDTITVSGAGSHAVEIWNIDGLEIGSVIARNTGEGGLLIQNSRNVKVGLVDGDEVGTGTGYGTLRFANTNGLTEAGDYETNVYIDKVVSRGGGRGVFCVSESGGAEIAEIDLADNGSDAILIENCYNLAILSGTVSGGDEVRVSARDEFENTKDVSITATVSGTTVRESPCGENVAWTISGDAEQTIC